MNKLRAIITNLVALFIAKKEVNNMNPDMILLRQEAIKYAYTFIGDFYRWGGSDPSGFDCSGFVCEILQSVGLIPRKADFTAQTLFDTFKNYKVADGDEGCLVFYYGSDPSKIIHVEFCINKIQSVGASGGGSNTLTTADAVRDKAFIKIRPFKSRTGIFGFVNPFMIKV